MCRRCGSPRPELLIRGLGHSICRFVLLPAHPLEPDLVEPRGQGACFYVERNDPGASDGIYTPHLENDELRVPMDGQAFGGRKIAEAPLEPAYEGRVLGYVVCCSRSIRSAGKATILVNDAIAVLNDYSPCCHTAGIARLTGPVEKEFWFHEGILLVWSGITRKGRCLNIQSSIEASSTITMS